MKNVFSRKCLDFQGLCKTGLPTLWPQTGEMSSLAVLESQSPETEIGEAHASAESRDELRLASSVGMTLNTSIFLGLLPLSLSSCLTALISGPCSCCTKGFLQYDVVLTNDTFSNSISFLHSSSSPYEFQPPCAFQEPPVLPWGQQNSVLLPLRPFLLARREIQIES